NVWGNGIENPNYNYHTIFRMIKDVAPEKKLTVFSTWQDNRTKLIGEGKPETGNLLLDYKFDGLELDTVNFPHDKESKYIQKIDDWVALEAAKCVTKNAPDLTWVYLQYTDDAGHHYGDSKKFDEAVLQADKQIGKIYEAILKRQKKHHEEWVIFVTTDHGRDPISGKGHGGQTARERGTWIVTNAKGLNNYFYAGNPGIVDITPSIMEFLALPIPPQSRVEVDGVSLIGKISLANPYVLLTSSKKLQIGWDAYDSEGVVKISIAQTNNFQLTGTPDALVKLGEAPIKGGKFVADFLPQAGKVYKIVLEGKYNTVNKWIVVN
ncbi:MAG TPA: alkaline phosphatase family protein, partial [Niabella sp.]|nr:alkaline phosphatase family protein [Niabella sp.]